MMVFMHSWSAVKKKKVSDQGRERQHTGSGLGGVVRKKELGRVAKRLLRWSKAKWAVQDNPNPGTTFMWGKCHSFGVREARRRTSRK